MEQNKESKNKFPLKRSTDFQQRCQAKSMGIIFSNGARSTG